MKTHIIRNLVVAVIGLVIIGAVWAAVKAQRGPALVEPGPTINQSTSTDQVAAPATTTTTGTDRIKVALLDYSGERDGKQRGCDRVILVERPVERTTAPLTAALRELFAMKETEVDGLGNFIPRTRTTLAFDSATIQDGIAKIYLKGSLSGLAGVCDDPRAKIQIEETALQFPTVQNVELYLNGTRTELQPNEKGE